MLAESFERTPALPDYRRNLTFVFWDLNFDARHRVTPQRPLKMGTLSALFVVRDPHARSLFADMVPLLDMNCEFVQSARDAFTRLQSQVPDLVVFDLGLLSDAELAAFDRCQYDARFGRTRFVGLHCDRRVQNLGFQGTDIALLKPILHAVADLEELLPYQGGVLAMADSSRVPPGS